VLPFDKQWTRRAFRQERPVIEALVVAVHTIMGKVTKLVRLYAIKRTREHATHRPPKIDQELMRTATQAVRGTNPAHPDADFEELRALAARYPALQYQVQAPADIIMWGTMLNRALDYEHITHVACVKRHFGDYHRMVSEFVNRTLKQWLKEGDPAALVQEDGDTARERLVSRRALIAALKDFIFTGLRTLLDALPAATVILGWIELHFLQVRLRAHGLDGEDLPVDATYRVLVVVILESFPEQALRPLLYMAVFLQAWSGSSFEVVPQRKSLIPGFIRIDTGTLVRLLYGDLLELRQDILRDGERGPRARGQWLRALSRRALHTQRRSQGEALAFAHSVMTDGVSLRILMASEPAHGKRNADAARRIEGTERRRELTEGMTAEQGRATMAAANETRLADAAELRREFLVNNGIPERDAAQRARELPYVDHLRDPHRQSARAAAHFYIDPGSRFVTTAIGDGPPRKRNKPGAEPGPVQVPPCEVILKYSARQRAYETRRFKRRKRLERLKVKASMLRLEHMHFDETYSRSVDVKTYAQYIAAWEKVDVKSRDFYRRPWHRADRLQVIYDTRKSTDKAMQRMAQAFGADAYGFCGDMCLPGARGFKAIGGNISTPFPGTLGALQRQFGRERVFLVNEGFTSKKSHRQGHEDMGQLRVRDKHGAWRSLYSCQTRTSAEGNRMEVIHRDLNAARNIRFLARTALGGGARPDAFPRMGGGGA